MKLANTYSICRHTKSPPDLQAGQKLMQKLLQADTGSRSSCTLDQTCTAWSLHWVPDMNRHGRVLQGLVNPESNYYLYLYKYNSYIHIYIYIIYIYNSYLYIIHIYIYIIYIHIYRQLIYRYWYRYCRFRYR